MELNIHRGFDGRQDYNCRPLGAYLMLVGNFRYVDGYDGSFDALRQNAANAHYTVLQVLSGFNLIVLLHSS